MKLERAKGTRDFLPEDKLLRDKVVDTLKKNFALFGFNPLETPILEKFSTLSSKYAGGAEILKETFTLKDQGERDLGLRYDLTVPFSRFVAMNPNLKMPFKRYQVGRVFRDGPIKLGRYREFWQCDCDVVGTRSLGADAECVLLFLKSFEELNLDVRVRLNNRKLLDSMMEACSVPEESRGDVILILDKLEKKPRKEIVEELEALMIKDLDIETLFETIQGDLDYFEKKFSGSEGLKELKEVLSLCNSDRVEFFPSLARGLSYYTGSLFEVYLVDSKIKSSVGSGGRYDRMISDLLESKQDYPAVGCSFGLDVICDALKEKGNSLSPSMVQVYVCPIGVSLEEVWSIVQKLRDAGLACDVDFNSRSPSKNLAYVNKYAIPYCLMVGSNELESNKFTLKDMKGGSEEKVSLNQVVGKLSP